MFYMDHLAYILAVTTNVKMVWDFKIISGEYNVVENSPSRR
jgi:hypothetical protein